MVWLGLLYANFPNSYAAALIDVLSRESNPRQSVELHQNGTFWTLYRLNYTDAALQFPKAAIYHFDPSE